MNTFRVRVFIDAKKALLARSNQFGEVEFEFSPEDLSNEQLADITDHFWMSNGLVGNPLDYPFAEINLDLFKEYIALVKQAGLEKRRQKEQKEAEEKARRERREMEELKQSRELAHKILEEGTQLSVPLEISCLRKADKDLYEKVVEMCEENKRESYRKAQLQAQAEKEKQEKEQKERVQRRNEWVNQFGTPVQKEKMARGLLEWATIDDEIRKQVFEPLDIFPRYRRLTRKDVIAFDDFYGAEYEDLEFDCVEADFLPDESYLRLVEIEKVVKEAFGDKAKLEADKHMAGYENKSDWAVMAFSAKVTVNVDGFTFSRRLLLSEPMEYSNKE